MNIPLNQNALKEVKSSIVVPKWMSVNIPVIQNVLNEVKSFILFSARGS